MSEQGIPGIPGSEGSGLNGKQRKYLRGLAHGLEPRVHLGKHGLTDALLRNLDEVLEHHELVKLKFLDFKDEKKELVAEMERRLDCESAGTIGHHVILFRRARQPEHREIQLPGEGKKPGKRGQG